MPELPEVESVRRQLVHALCGRRITHARAHRPDYVRGTATPRALLAGRAVSDVRRHGKQCAVLDDAGRGFVIQLGMSGHIEIQPPGARTLPAHTHVAWRLESGERVLLVDPRRFGRVTLFADDDALAALWDPLGPDALTINARVLRTRLEASAAAVKSRLLDQHAIAGLGNIYADEALFRARVRPTTPARHVPGDRWRPLAGAIRAVLRAAIDQGGSTLRDYRLPDGRSGGFKASHRVYGRAGLPCVRCGGALASGLVSQRTTVWCDACQPE